MSEPKEIYMSYVHELLKDYKYDIEEFDGFGTPCFKVSIYRTIDCCVSYEALHYSNDYKLTIRMQLKSLLDRLYPQDDPRSEVAMMQKNYQLESELLRLRGIIGGMRCECDRWHEATDKKCSSCWAKQAMDKVQAVEAVEGVEG